jgi:hypothetical protein
MSTEAHQLELDIEIEDNSDQEDTVAPVKYDISSFGIDFDVEGLCRRLRREEIFVPPFQRSYVWSLAEASRFIESLLLGLPVPGIFLAREEDSGRLLVIDGQQRLKTLLFFCEGKFNPQNEKKSAEFKLVEVQGEFLGRSYNTLEERNRLDLDNAIIHATIVKQDHPQEDNTSIYHIFERLNSGGRRLYPQEMRSALYHGDLIDTVQELNNYENWRNIFGKPSQRLRDQELILRFLALHFSEEEYSRPLKEFLTKFLIRHRSPHPKALTSYTNTFKDVSDLWWDALGQKAFRPSAKLNAAVFDSMFVGLARRLEQTEKPTSDGLFGAYSSLLNNQDYMRMIVTQSTSEEASVATRLDMATKRISET